MGKFKRRKFAIRVQMRDKSKRKPRRVSLVSSKRIMVRGKAVKPGQRATGGKDQLRKTIAKRTK